MVCKFHLSNFLQEPNKRILFAIDHAAVISTGYKMAKHVMLAIAQVRLQSINLGAGPGCWAPFAP